MARGNVQRIPAFKSQVLRQYQEKRINSFTHYFNKYLSYMLGSLLNRILRIKSSVLRLLRVNLKTQCDKSKDRGNQAW